MKKYFLKYFRVIFLFILAFVIFHSLNQSKTEEIFIIEETKNREEIIGKMLEKGIIRKDLSYYFIKLYLSLGGEIEPGGYVLRKGMGAVNTILNMNKPEYRFVSVLEGERKGEIAENLGKELEWNSQKIKIFSNQNMACELIGQEGFLASGRYLIHKDEDPEIIQLKMQENYYNKIKELGVEKTDISQSTITTIASLIQRESGGKNDMRLISGIIWNRLAKGMPLQIDATLQYIKGDEENWWPIPNAEDKYLESDFNTYKNKGLPPSPIATPGEYAILAAMNPLKTDCLYYLHDKYGKIHCSTNYEAHKRNVKYYLK